ncbi:helix-hairpin-helix domain-containing protein [Actinomycetospora endophytica]|uniref:Helix-hairpin-helix domain-containing protein n=1 Tax=Actinomycetospora endophytica TaxID=2291215 RepID=A0ABS8PJ91_9PSEU|nr:ComEA family DNA-binding protein [Actinomycetospora endophytica]MCD2198007.1 helix-hairpin-helix domain-containing protein [Actinomycetospora endophytica]
MVPDDARLRLQTLGAPRPPDPGSGDDGGSRAWPVGPVPGEAWSAGPGRAWSAAPDGTPGARLRVVGDPGPRESWGSPDAWESDDDVPPGPAAGSPQRSAWDTPRRGPARWLPASWLAARWDPGGWGAIGLAVVAAVAAVAAAVGVWAGRPVAEPVPALPVVAAGAPTAGSGGAPTASAGPAPGGPVVVNVAGKVRRPGLVTVRDGARIGEAVDAAGGALPAVDLTPLNLAARVVDGQQILVGVAAPPSAAAPAAAPAGGGGGAGGAAAPASGGKLDLNAATLEQLDGLTGVGPVTAKKILDWRTQNGRFTAVEQLREIPGIGDARFSTLRELVRV